MRPPGIVVAPCDRIDTASDIRLLTLLRARPGYTRFMKQAYFVQDATGQSDVCSFLAPNFVVVSLGSPGMSALKRDTPRQMRQFQQ